MKLVAPVYSISPAKNRVVEFKGLNKKTVIEDGEMRDMKNLASDEYPNLYQRKPRGEMRRPPGSAAPMSMLVKYEKLAIIDEDGNFWYDEIRYPISGLTADTQMVAINTRICFFPQKKCIQVKGIAGEPIGTVKDLEASATGLSGTIAKLDTVLGGQKITFASGDISGFAAGDAVLMTCSITVNGTTMTYGANNPISCLIETIDSTAKTIVIPDETFLELSAEGETSGTLANVSISRSCPNLDFVMEHNNRLWGVSNADNTIYACKLGDPTNWQYYQDTSLDSYYAEQGTDGKWTGVAPYSGHLLFFKEDCIHKVYGTSPETFQILTAKCHALEAGSSKSVAIINDVVLYKSRLGIMAYDGGTPVLISEKFGSSKYKDVIAGTDGMKYYASVMKETGTVDEFGKDVFEPVLIVYDMERYLWHKEDDIRAREFEYYDGKVIFICDNDSGKFEKDNIYIIAADEPLYFEKDVSWSAIMGPYDEYIEDKKVYSKTAMRVRLDEGAELDIYIQIDEGEWEHIQHIANEYGYSMYVPIVPRRCNKFAVKLEGVGYCRIESFQRSYREAGSGRM